MCDGAARIAASVIVFVSAAVFCLGCAGETQSPYHLDHLLTLADVQARGTHNSYHLEPADLVDPSHAYSHLPLASQLAEQGVRQFELDLHLRTDQGFEVFHLPSGVDQETTCRRFVDCLDAIEAWSSANRWHVPVLIWLEPKDLDLDWAEPDLEEFVGRYDGLEAEILSVFDPSRIITPDEVRAGHDSLSEAVASKGWPPLGNLRGRVLFALLDSEEHREAYLEWAPDLAGSLIFISADDSSDPNAGIFKINNAQTGGEQVRALVEAGYLVTSNADGVEQSDENNAARRDASLAAGVHYLSSDFPGAVEDGYWLEIAGGVPARCNPVHAPDACVPREVENLSGD